MSDVNEQQAPVPNESTPIWELVVLDMLQRDRDGRAKYALQAGNGRDALVDAYQEALDLCVYLKQAIVERDAGLFLDAECVESLRSLLQCLPKSCHLTTLLRERGFEV